MIVPPSERAYVEDVWNKLLKQRGGSRGTNQNIRKDGKLIFCEWYNSTLVDDAGHVIAVAG